MILDLKKLKSNLTPKNMAIGAGVFIILGIFGIAAFSVVMRPKQAIAQEVPATTAPPLIPTATAASLPTPVPTLAPPPPTPVSTHFVSWTNRETGIYLRDAPGNALILDAIPNGEEVSNVGNQTTVRGGVEWIEANYLGQSGWIATLYLFEIEGNYQRIGEDGRWLFRDMNGMVDMYLWAGTPYQVLQTATDENGIVWQEIMLPDSSTGWMKEW
ncbi:MAG: hypothetical protein ISS57_09510 [Anaerolineales bacterium]|nr:hypothetical protein [Anaerolineales bacterium]